MAITQSPLEKVLEQIDLPVSEADVKAHVILPPNIAAARSARRATNGPAPAKPPAPRHTYVFDVTGFANAVQADLANAVAGYAMRVHQNGATVYTLEWNWAKEPQDGGTGWTPEIRMHIASCSKLVTAIAMTKLLDERSLDASTTKIIGYLPTYWSKGPGVDQVTFADLLTHKSGFHFGQDESPSDYTFMKQQVAAGTTHVGTYDYQNMNFGLCRILLSTINGNVPVGLTSPVLEDTIWDLVTLQDYQDYCVANVFGPGKVSDASLAHADGDALAYSFPVSGNGWNSGDTTAVAGGAGWHMSVDDLLGIMGAFRRDGTIVTAAQAQASLDAGFGIDWIGSTPLGTYYAKNGGWGDGSHTEQCVAFFLPQNTEVVVFVNSQIGASPGEFLMQQVLNHYLDNVK